ncbi:MAG: TetR/AcrR family transcriptional regulator [Candidatus Dormibacter sp.]|uniref:TetR/AcrR family transcriptional regulator n=1 Tax=Candidatus Dormibacter sp. TaxID=2973982 RepID=UPI000DB2A17E|nr:MAG: TetR family transcriptional regulator [Candidatus Dormibacteraeota bacterium]
MTRATSRRDTRARIVDVAARLLQEEGPVAVTTRGVAERAGVQAPTIYRLFGDKDGLLEAVAEHVMSTYVSAKAEIVEAASAADVDPVEELRDGWTMQIDFGLANPALFRLLSDPDRVRHSPAARSGKQVLQARIRRIALTGRLRVSEHHAVDLIQAAGIGAIHTLLSTPPDQRDPDLAPSILQAVLTRILADTPEPAHQAPIEAAVALRAIAPQLDMLSHPERQLLAEWLDRAIKAMSANL